MRIFINLLITILISSCNNIVNYDSPKINIIGIGNFSEQDLEIVKSTVESNFPYNCEILKNDQNNIEDVIDCEVRQNEMFGNPNFNFDKEKDIIIFLTDNDLVSLGKKVRGVTYGNTIYICSQNTKQIKSTLCHELAHNFGVEHCHNECIMNIDNSQSVKRYNNAYWCDSLNKPIFCENCKVKLP